MKLPISWIKEYVKIDKKPEKLAQTLTLSGTEVEEIIRDENTLKNVVVGEITAIIKHSNADRLRVCKVRVKKGKILKIVCGAPNIKVGQKVPVALPGAELPNGTKIEKTKIRGEESEGMLLAEDELGIGQDHSGIYILEEDEKIGRSIRSVLGLNEVIFDLALTPNRADCFSVFGIAREVSAVTKRKIKKNPSSYLIKDEENKISRELKVSVLAKNLCPKYTARVIKGVKVADSPEKIKNRLRACGIRPINNVVDITNYVMLELGQPLHAFDYDKLAGSKGQKKIIVRQAKSKEKLVTLDGKERDLEKGMLVIADKFSPIALAGVMGGENTEISEETKNVILESAVFKPYSVRKTAQKLGLRSESSNLFEKGLDSFMTEIALDRAASLIEKYAGGKIVPGRLAVVQKEKDLRPKVSLSLERLRLYLNKKIALGALKRIFNSLGFEFLGLKDEKITLRVPSWRQDVRLPEDLIEEVGRIYNYNRLKPTYLKGILKPVELPKGLYWEDKIKNILVAADMTEVYNYSFYSENDLKAFGFDPKDHYRLKNPLNPEQEYLRKSLIPLMIKNVSFNSDFSESISIFEIGNVFFPGKDLPKEKKMVAGVFWGGEAYFAAKAALDLLLVKGLNIEKFLFEVVEQKTFLKANNRIIGQLYILPEVVKKYYKIKKQVAYFELELIKLINLASEKTSFIKPSHYPAIIRDLSFFIPRDVRYVDVEKEIKESSPLIQEIELFDIYQREGKVSLAIRITFQSRERTLEAKEVDEIIKRISRKLEDNYKIIIRR